MRSKNIITEKWKNETVKQSKALAKREHILRVKLLRQFEPNYRELFIKTADKVWTDIRCGVITIDTAMIVLRGILEAKNEQAERTKIKFERL